MTTRIYDATAAWRRLRSLAGTLRRNQGADQRARVLLHVVSRAARTAQDRVYGRAEGSPAECFELLRGAAISLGQILEDTAEQEGVDSALDRDLAKRLGRAFARAVHAALAHAWHQGGHDGSLSHSRALEKQVAEAERSYRLGLLAARSSCRAGNRERLHSVLEELIKEVLDDLAPLTRRVARLSSEDRDKGALGLRVARRGRRSAMFAAALVLLAARLSSGRTRGTTADIGQSRRKLTRDRPRLRAGGSSLVHRNEGDRVRIRGRISEISWIDRPEKPYTRLSLEDAEFEVHAHFKNLRRLGVEAGMSVWAAGKIEAVDKATAVVAEFEGPGVHAGNCWEDWLADEVRDAYDLYPEVLYMEWEYPPAGSRRVADLRSRVDKRLGGEV
jgi:hypothetical protein